MAIKVIEISTLDLAFPTNVDGILPAWEEIPDQFKKWNGTKWNRLFNDWFHLGLKSIKLIPKKGIDIEKAIRMVSYCMRSWEPKHEHKEAGCAYLLSEFFKDAKWEVNKP